MQRQEILKQHFVKTSRLPANIYCWATRRFYSGAHVRKEQINPVSSKGIKIYTLACIRILVFTSDKTQLCSSGSFRKVPASWKCGRRHGEKLSRRSIVGHLKSKLFHSNSFVEFLYKQWAIIDYGLLSYFLLIPALFETVNIICGGHRLLIWTLKLCPWICI